MEGRIDLIRTASRTTLAQRYGKRRDRYLELIHQFPLRPIENEADLDAAITVIDSLIDQDSLSGPEQDYLEVLGDLVEAYETVNYPSEPVSDGEMLKYLLEINGVTQAAVAKAAGIAVSTISEVLSGKRKLNRRQIGKLAKYFHVGPGVFHFGDT
jgi:HTH-type transcriptional regulator/antitoxin HigA